MREGFRGYALWGVDSLTLGEAVRAFWVCEDKGHEGPFFQYEKKSGERKPRSVLTAKSQSKAKLGEKLICRLFRELSLKETPHTGCA